jgi:DegV family protein with EDD domain
MTDHSAMPGGPPAIVTDSTCDLPPEMYDEYGIERVPLSILFGTESYRSGIDMDMAQFVARLEQGDAHPTTSQPTANDFLAVYRRLAEAGKPVLSIHLSEGLSGTVNAARQAAQQLPDHPITVWDSGTISAALGLQVLTAARAAQAGYEAAQIVPLLEQTHRDANLLFTLDDLSYLVRGGRIGSVRYHIAQTLRIKPIITVSKSGETAGTYVSAGRARSMEKAVDAFVNLIVKDVGEGSTLRAMSFHGDDPMPEIVARLNEQLRARFDVVFLASASSTPVLGVHVGPLAFDVGYAPGDWPV